MIKNIIILDDHPIFQAGLKMVIDPESMLRVIDMCRTAKELLFSLRIRPADILLVDCSCLGSESELPALIQRLQQHQPHIALILMGDSISHQNIAEQCYSIIEGYICKTLPVESFLTELHRVRRKLDREFGNSRENDVAMGFDVPFVSQRLTIKEKTVIKHLLNGLSVTQIAEHLNRSVKTISTQKRQAMIKLDIKNNRDLFELKIHEL
ncbi:response regulator transcription factor [Enterobacter quasiroggenkampii]|uniref:response regulator transcription factor n=1 Tax=Enterobacter quasiroggenkampii TaxID=2497436 RepID=UPI0021D1CF02|nr:response regulator transcription factor [Enterobacter quasiroggenkampii]MCU6406195.1 response regulator transcription factor [Enterobacter quasiroggenkampii]